MFFELLILKETILTRINARLASHPLQINFQNRFTKTWTLPQGTIDHFLDISLKASTSITMS